MQSYVACLKTAATPCYAACLRFPQSSLRFLRCPDQRNKYEKSHSSKTQSCSHAAPTLGARIRRSRRLRRYTRKKRQSPATEIGSKDVLNNLSEWRVVSNEVCRASNHVKAKNLTVPADRFVQVPDRHSNMG